jgi:hypothetical protein
MARGKPRGKTLWEMLLEKIQGPVEFAYYNPLRAKVGSFVTIDEIDLKDHDFRVEEIREYLRRIGGKKFLFADYVLLARPRGKDEVTARLRLNPVDNPDRHGGMTHHALYLRLDDEMKYDKDFHNVVTDDTGVFEVLDEGEVTAKFWRINDVLKPYKARVTVIRDDDRDGKAEREELETAQVEYWDYWRETDSPAGNPVKEYLFVEMDADTGWFQIWRGHEIDMQRAFVV